LHQPLPPFAATAGPHNAKVVIVGEAFGQSEAQLRQPFVGESGKELWNLLGEGFADLVNDNWYRATELHKYGLAWVKERGKWLEDASILMTNALALQPPGNKLETLCVAKKDLGPESYIYPAISKGKYLQRDFLCELERLRVELQTVRPNLIICLGNTACWAILHATNISSIRGAVALGIEKGCGPNIKCIASYHPAAVLRQWNWRPVVVADLMKASREAKFPEIRRPSRQVLVDPTLRELEEWTAKTLASPPQLLGIDCETKFGQIECISFARSPSDSIVVPFIDQRKTDWSYWPTVQEELAAWFAVNTLLTSPDIPKCFQNGMYDLQYILPAGLRPRRLQEDTMLLHHSIYPEMLKGLGFLGSIYSDEASWKLMRRRRPDTEKRDE
jgi:uracil-DNA glycosylase